MQVLTAIYPVSGTSITHLDLTRRNKTCSSFLSLSLSDFL